MTPPVCSVHGTASTTGFSQITHSSMCPTHYQSPAADVDSHQVALGCIFVFHTSNAFWCVFILACPPMLQRQCIQLELKMIMAGLRSYTCTMCLSLKLKKGKSCLRWPAALTQINFIGKFYLKSVISNVSAVIKGPIRSIVSVIFWPNLHDSNTQQHKHFVFNHIPVRATDNITYTHTHTHPKCLKFHKSHFTCVFTADFWSWVWKAR